MPKVRTSINPEEEIEVSDDEAQYLDQQGLLTNKSTPKNSKKEAN